MTGGIGSVRNSEIISGRKCARGWKLERGKNARILSGPS